MQGKVIKLRDIPITIGLLGGKNKTLVLMRIATAATQILENECKPYKSHSHWFYT